MQTVPSLIGAGTAVAAAATGLVFGQPADGQCTPRSMSSRRKPIPERDFLNVFPTSTSRPGTTASTAPPTPDDEFIHCPNQQFPPSNATSQPRIPRRSSHTQITPPKSLNARHSFARQGDLASTGPIPEDSRDSISSNSSWIRRLSIRPLSQHESVRSSVGPGSPSITFSHGSAAPILSPTGYAPPPLPRNKLVKRASASNGGNTTSLARRGSKPQISLRRPATSHQRSATLHQQLNAELLPPPPKFSLDPHARQRAQTLGHPSEPVPGLVTDESSTWKSFWHAHISFSIAKTLTLRSSDSVVQPATKRICVEQQDPRQAYLVTSNSLRMDSPQGSIDVVPKSENRTDTEDSPQASDKSGVSPGTTPSKQPRRSLSMHFSSPSSWITKSGSLRRRKRGVDTIGGKRHVSAPVTGDANSTQADKTDAEVTANGTKVSHAESELATIFRPPNRKRNSSSPLPPLPRLSSFHMDLKRTGSSSSGVHGRLEEPAAISPTAPRVASNGSHTRTLERASTVASSEYRRGFTSGDDEDTDFKTDTPFDSLRTVASGRRRTLDSPLESMFDESPPSTAGNASKPKRLSIQEILGPSFDGGNKIMEEDENLPTPVRATYEDAEARFYAANIEDDEGFKYCPTSPNFILDRDYGRLSLDDDDDLDWAKEDDNEIFNHLSPPGSMNSRRGSPNPRVAPGHVSSNRRSNVRSDSASERPRSTVFDWAEPCHDKYDGDSHLRPKTVHGKQELDIRGGRSASRKGPAPAHVRSQSVPIVPDQTETAKSVTKFGTWGLGQKNVSEDWDDDFEFDEEDVGPFSGKKEENQFSMIVPASIQATQPTVKAHSGQIRELSLLVNDLKRLCRLGREMDMLSGSSAKLWREAEGIIALASPDEDTADDLDYQPRSIETHLNSAEAKFIDQGFDGASLGDLESCGITETQRNAVVRDRPAGRRRSVFSPEDDIFGMWDQADTDPMSERPRTPDNQVISCEYKSTSVARSVMEAMQPQHLRSNADCEDGPTPGKLNFDTNSLKELVKRASDLRDGLSDLVRKADHITHSPARTPKHTRADGSPAFTRVFDEPASSPTRRVAHSHSNNSILSGSSVGASPSNGLSQRMQVMTVS
ncbi:hypothetical protein F4779DRAFT_312332 [Xylariaceae sp. FL0662B]|nr:hypothetical protein F4779DRAFT_312332 [Xylariaceae sp. FL0662B]